MFARSDVAVRIAALLVPGLLYAAPAVSQDGRGTNRPTDAANRPAAKIPEAPVGHRQPTAADVPKEQTQDAADQARAKRDRELDSKLQICRGC